MNPVCPNLVKTGDKTKRNVNFYDICLIDITTFFLCLIPVVGLNPEESISALLLPCTQFNLT